MYVDIAIATQPQPQKYLELIITSIAPMTAFLSQVTIDLAFIAGLR